MWGEGEEGGGQGSRWTPCSEGSNCCLQKQINPHALNPAPTPCPHTLPPHPPPTPCPHTLPPHPAPTPCPHTLTFPILGGAGSYRPPFTLTAHTLLAPIHTHGPHTLWK